MAMRNAVRSAIDATTASTGVKIVAAPTLAQYDALAADVSWLDKTTSTLVANGAEWSLIKAALHSANLSVAEAAGELGFANVIVVPGMTARSAIVPYSSVGMVGRIPQIVAKYQESGVETDEDSGLSVGIVVADDQKENRIVVNADLWFGVAAVSANAAATENTSVMCSICNYGVVRLIRAAVQIQHIHAPALGIPYFLVRRTHSFFLFMRRFVPSKNSTE